MPEIRIEGSTTIKLKDLEKDKWFRFVDSEQVYCNTLVSILKKNGEEIEYEYLFFNLNENIVYTLEELEKDWGFDNILEETVIELELKNDIVFREV